MNWRAGAVLSLAVGVAAVSFVVYTVLADDNDLPSVSSSHEACETFSVPKTFGQNRVFVSTTTRPPELLFPDDILTQPCILHAFPEAYASVHIRVDVDSHGLVQRVLPPPALSREAEACVEKIATLYVFMPAIRCDGTTVPSVADGGFSKARAN